MVEIDAPAIIAHAQVQESGVMPGLEFKETLGVFAGGLALLGRFQSMIEGVAQEMRQRRFQSFQDFPVHAGGLARDFKADLLVQLPCQIAHHPRESQHPVGKGAHPAGNSLAIKALGQIGRPAREEIHLFEMLGGQLAAFVGFPLGLDQARLQVSETVSFLAQRTQMPQQPRQFGLAFLEIEQIT